MRFDPPGAGARGVIALIRRLQASGYAGRIAAVTAAGMAVRLILLGRQPLWRDEAFTALAVQRPLGGMLDAVRHDSAPPLAYLLDRVVALVSTSPGALRLLSATAGVTAIPLGAALGRRLGGDRAGCWAAIACALSPALVASSRDARMYALATTLVMATTLLLWRAVGRPAPGRWALYGAAVVLAMYTQYFAVFAILAQLAAALLILRPAPRTAVWAVATPVVAGLSLIPWLLFARAQFTHGSAPFWVEPVGVKTLSSLVMQFFSGPPVDPGIPGRAGLQTLQAIAVGAGSLGAYALVRQRRDLGPAAGRGAAFLAACGLGAIALFVAVSLWHPLVEGRYAGVVWGPLLPLIGTGFSLIRCRPVVVAAVAALASASTAPALATLHPDAQAVAEQLRHEVAPDDLVSADPGTYLLLLYYGDPAVRARTHVLSDNVPWFWGTAVYPANAIIPEVPEDVIGRRATIYHVVETDSAYERPAPRGYGLVERTCYVGICVERYRPGPRS